MQIHCVQFDIAWEDKAASHARAEALIEAARPSPGGLIVLPELGDVGFSFALERIVDDRSEEWARTLAARWKCWVLHGWPMRGPDGKGRNVSGVCSPDGTLIGVAEKMHPFTIGNAGGVYMPGDRVRVFDCEGVSLCPLICYDLRFPEVFRRGMREGAELFTVIANWPKQRAAHWRSLLIARAIENQAIVVGCNRVGSDPSFEYAGGSLIVDAEGVVVAEGGSEDEVVSAEVDVAEMRRWREAFPVLRDVRGPQ
jgi:predicted amidohydrolase